MSCYRPLDNLLDWVHAIAVCCLLHQPPHSGDGASPPPLELACAVLYLWVPPRGLNSLLLLLLVALAVVPRPETLLALIGVVVGASLILHRLIVLPVAGWYERKVGAGLLIEYWEATSDAF
jgi:hypothetical protein